ncbi:Rac GTPase-activating protein BCR/ABR [Yamadazyma tenuis]|uniref:Zn(2)-C6 fungal-type domain-containing protein n=1 Tax=Candida tenuis (strain ATCC 10573 / BCRC 21748 / CBS 615 / JCM 9827 / NBRC 10315 / NRRL Y-1498 / VKM Y-70) TaxID=590646 RepID=G3B2X5_CANTC|nr:uncharacterized protein CANTEDRAFT_120778 [Yamadazyma tenuis ATCC 10573]XP_006686010.1 uncharacterized protein CANTEDRAFT_120778 [Yamadazyma tenuis ATCC 10573]EGV65203.1 hypothetical protein CANTEDRAFT_120778 [Yamadazyma tenuis ATCC 10573]EGV65204.1 hypothetical protein CANTEDRAFT_120778 [Yamadazyma tenuis ATCC 10573]WEJ97581.1 Rac GTPase-activating protein BCR/ABR [Yamadazyma tenuis]
MDSNLVSRFKIQKPSSYNKDSSKNRYSCTKCRQLKKKCTKEISGCYNCSRYSRQCTYLDRKASIPKPVPTEPSALLDETAAYHEKPFLVPSPSSSPSASESHLLLQSLGFSQWVLNKTDTVVCPPITKELASKFVEAYFKHNHRSYPFICQSAFIQEFSKLESLEDSVTNYFGFEIFMIMAIGCTTLSRVGLLRQEDIYSKFFSSQCVKFLSQGITFTSVETIKMLLLLCIYSFFEPQGLQTWNLFGQVARATISSGLNKGVKGGGLDNEMKNRLFWSIHNMDRLLSISLGRPLTIDEYDIDVPVPAKLDDEENFTYKTIVAIINLRQIEGLIIKKLYSIRARDIYQQKEITQINDQLDQWLKLRPNRPENLKFFSFHGSDVWYLARYYHNLMLLYRPSYLVPRPTITELNSLGDYCLQSLSYTHKLFEAKLLPLNWITLYRFLTVCSSVLYCLCNWSIDLNESKAEIYFLVEILDAFSANWVFASKCSKVVKNIVDNILEVSLTASGDEFSNVKLLSSELLGASSAYHEILSDNSIDISFPSYLYDELIP